MPKPAQSGHQSRHRRRSLRAQRGGGLWCERGAVRGHPRGNSAQVFSPKLGPRVGPQFARASAEQNADFCAGLRLEELALARACAAGNERAWQDFITRYRQKLHGMALHITRDAAHAAELADSLFADLYGVNTRDGIRSSKLVFYTGRGSLEGWLRTVMAQEFINRYRKQKRTVSLEEQTEEGVQFAAAVQEPACTLDRTSNQRLEAATDEALAELSSEDRFTLASYYLDGRTLAEIARTLGLHESSISRRLDRLATGSGSVFWRGCECRE